jgi:alpha-tubulin suppressor-like RCC1 family protein/streptogramin lyase
MRPRILTCLSAALVLLGILGCYSPGGSGVSGRASLTPGVTAQPQNQTVALGGTATFQAASTGLPLPSYQWERSNDSGATWSSVPGATGTSYALANAAIADNQAQFHVVLTDPAGSTTSNAATLSVTASTGASQVVVSLPPGSVPTGITKGPDGNLWFTNSGAGQIGKLDSLTHQVALINLPDPTCKPVGITSGPDGNLWFTEQVGGKLGVMTTAGALNNEFPVGSGPTGIVTGSDGNLWVTLLTGNQIAKVNVAGIVSLFPLPTSGASPSGITLSADGSVWFTETAVAQIGEISPAGAILEWSVQTPAGGVTPVPMGITSTPDGAIWYSDGANNCIGKFVPSNPVPLVRLPGVMSAMDTPPAGVLITLFFPLAAGANPDGLTTDVQGQVWITEQGLDEVAVITLTTQPGTTPGSYPLPASGGLPAALVLGPDGDIWVTLPGTNEVVMVVDIAPTNQVAVAVLPVSATVIANGTLNFAAIVTNTPTATVTWSVLEAGGGSITPDTGLYAAPGTAGIYHVVATSNAVTPPVAGTAAVTVTVPAISAVTPANPTVQGGGVVLFSAQVSGLNDDSIVWSASDGVMIPTTGVWTAPYTAETVTITATSNMDATLTATTQVLIPPSGTAVPVITTPPASQTVSAGSTATFNVVATGATTLIYQWQVSINGGATWSNVGTGATSYTTPGTTAAYDGYLYQVVVGNGAGANVTSGAARLTVTYAPVITTQPLSQGVILGSQATFLVAANGEPAPSFTWQLSQDGGNTWAAVSTGTGGGGPIYTTAATLGTDNGNRYRVIVANGISSVTSGAATLTLAAVPFGISTAPANQTVVAGNTATFTVTAYGPALTYQWQVSTDGGATWNNVSGATGTSYTTGGTSHGDNGTLYQVIVTSGANNITSPAGKLTVQYAPVITTQPIAQVASPGYTATFQVAAQGDPATLTYQWQVSTNGGTSWAAPTGGSGAGSAQFITWTLAPGDDGTLFRVQVSDGIGIPAISSPVVLVVPFAPIITTQPGNLSVASGATATFTVAAAGEPAPAYQWQVSINGGSTWSNVGINAAAYTTPGTSSGNDGNLYRVAVSNALGAITSSSATLTVSYAPSITTQPTAQSVTAPNAATFTAAAAGDPAPTLQWQVSTNGGTSWTPIIGAYGPSYSTGATSFSNDGNLYQVVASNGVGSPAASNAVALTVAYVPFFTTQPIAQSVAAPATATFTAAAQGDPAPSYQWYVSPDGETWTQVPGATNASVNITPTSAANNGTYYQVQASNPAGTATSASVGLTVGFAPIVTVTAQDSRIAPGMNSTFSATVQANPAPTSYQWQVAGVNQGTATSTYADLTLNGITVSQPVNLIVTSTAGTSTTPGGPASVNVLSPYAGAFMAGGANHNLQLMGGNVYASGRNDLGQLGINSQSNALTFTEVQTFQYPNFISLANIVQVDAAGDHSLALDASNQVWWWGASSGSGVSRSPYAAAVTGLPEFNGTNNPVMLADNAASSFALLGDGTVYGWPVGGSPAQVTGLPFISAIAAADTDFNDAPVLLALDNTGALWACESPYTSVNPFADYSSTTSGNGIVAIYAGKGPDLYGLDAAGNIWQWSQANWNNQPGQVTFASLANGSSKCVALAKGAGFLLGIGSDNTLWAAGANANGQLSQQDTNPHMGFNPVNAWNNTNYYQLNALAAATGTAFAMARDTSGHIFTWGFAGYGELGNSSSAVVVPTGISLVWSGTQTQPWVRPVASSGNVLAYSTSSQELWSWGWDAGLNLNGSGAPGVTPYPMGLPNGSASLSGLFSSSLARHALAIDGSGNLWAWGLNNHGQLGNGSNANSNSAVSALYAYMTYYSEGVASAAAGTQHSLATDVGGQVWAWGGNSYGQLGNGYSGNNGDASQDVSTPFVVNLDSDFWNNARLVACGDRHSVLLQGNFDSTYYYLFAWGANDHGQVGSGGAESLDASPYYVMGFSGSGSAPQICAGSVHSLLLDPSGNVWAWGGNPFGQVGNGSITDLFQPAEVLGPDLDGPRIIQVAAGPNFSLALDSTGTLWGWGDNATGVLGTSYGLPSPLIVQTPQQVVILNPDNLTLQFGSMTATAHSVVATDILGNLWTWGLNQGGMLGIGSYYYNLGYWVTYLNSTATSVSLATP